MSPKRSGSSSAPETGLLIPVRLELVCLAALFSLILLVRVYCLDADPPFGLSVSADVYTDPSQYTLFAAQFVQTGDFNPLGDHRFAFFLKSAITVVAVGVFKLFGVGLVQSNAVGLLFSLGSLLLFFLFLRRVAGQVPALLFLLLICFNNNLLFYGRLPFLEHAMTFLAFLSMVLLVYVNRWWGVLLAGMSLASAILFGKLIGMIFIAPFVCYFGHQIYCEGDTGTPLPRRLFGPATFVIGFTAVTLFWLFFSYLPMQTQVAGYVGEKTLALYGTPEAFESIGNFIETLVSFGYDSRLFGRMPIVAVLGAVYVLIIMYRVSVRRPLRERLSSLTSGRVILLTTVIAFFLGLMIWNYRPLRYQLVLIYAFHGLAAMVLAEIWRKGLRVGAGKLTWPFYVYAFPVILVVVYQLAQGISDLAGTDFSFSDRIFHIGALAVVVMILIGAITQLYKSRAPALWLQPVVRIMIVALIIVVVGRTAVSYLYWTERPSFMAVDNSDDLEMILSPGAVLSGPYAPLLTLGTDFGVVIHMFGVSQPDPELFQKFPITHLLVDEQNESRSRKDYPEVMDSAVHLCTYHVGLKNARLFRIAGSTGNSSADAYRCSKFEVALDYYRQDRLAEGLRAAVEFVMDHPNNITGHLMLAERGELEDHLEEAEHLFEKAVEFSPSNYDLNARVAQFHKDQYEKSGDSRHRQEGLAYFEEAIRLAPTVKKIQEAYRGLKGTGEWQN